MEEDEYVFCPECKIRSYLKNHQCWDQKTAARRWLQAHCPRGIKRGCSTRLSTAAISKQKQMQKMSMYAAAAYAKKKKKTA